MSDELKPEETEVTKTETVDLEEYVKKLEGRISEIEGSKKELLDDLFKARSKYKGLKEEMESKQEEMTQQHGSAEEQLAMWQKKYNDAVSSANEQKKKVLTRDLQLEVAKHASDAQNIDDVIYNVGRMKDVVQLDDESMEWRGVQDAVSRLRDEKRYLFKDPTIPGQASNRPEGQKPKNISIDNWNELDQNENAQLDKEIWSSFFN